MGHLLHMAERSRHLGAIYASGLDPAGVDNYTTSVGTSVTMQIGAGVIYQMHTYNSTAKDTSAGDDMHFPNWTTPYFSTTNLYDISTDTNGNNLNNKYFNIVV